MTVNDSASPVTATATATPAPADSNVPLAAAEAMPVPVPVPIVPVPPPADSRVKKSTKTTRTYTIPPPAAPSAPPADTNTNTTAADKKKLLSDLGREPVSIICPFCRQVGLTRVDHECDAGSGASGVLLGVICCFCCVCLAFVALLPCCVNKMKMTKHRCRHCNRLVGKVRSFSDC